MHYKTQSMITIAVVLAIMVGVAIFVNSIDLGITGSTTKSKCSKNLDCYDGNSCTEDICLYPESKSASECLHKQIENCN